MTATIFVDPLRLDYVCRLRRSLYGSKQAPRAWLLRLNTFPLQLGFTSSTADTSIFILRTPCYVMFMLTYVDDIILIGTLNAPFVNLLASLNREFSMKDLGPLYFFLGIETHTTP